MKLIKKCNETIDKVEKKLTVVETDDEQGDQKMELMEQDSFKKEQEKIITYKRSTGDTFWHERKNIAKETRAQGVNINKKYFYTKSALTKT